MFNVILKKMGRKRKMVTEEKQKNNEKQPKQTADDKEASKDKFYWSDDEIQLLLMAVLDFKSQCEFERINWEYNIQ